VRLKPFVANQTRPTAVVVMGNYMSKKSTGFIISKEKYLISESESKLLTS
jgi:hypothetical protein